MHARLKLCILVALGGGFCLVGCGDRMAPVIGVDYERPKIPTWEEFRARSMYITESGQVHYIIEGDIGIGPNEATLRHYYQRKFIDLVEKSSVGVMPNGSDQVLIGNVVTFCISDEWGNDKQRALADMRAATSQWMSAANVLFTYQPQYDWVCNDAWSNVDIQVRPWNMGGIGCGPGDCNYLKMDYYGGGFTGKYSWLGAWTHEVGHTMGLAHENNSAPCTSPTISGQRIINSYDPNSSLHYRQYCNSGSTGQMTALDADGLRTLYGASSKPWIQVLPAEWIATTHATLL